MIVETVTKDAAHARSESGRMADLYARYGPGASRLAYLLMGDQPAAEDLVQEAFVRVFGRFRDLREPESFEWYLRRTVVNLANSRFRRLRLERAYERSRRAQPSSPLAIPDVAARLDLWRTLQRLPARQRAAIVLRFYEDLSEERTAEVMRCPVGTVKSLVSRGLARLRSEVSRDA
jgi:RNA polymerase sigma-70 factor (sigma-E family)